MTNFFTNLKTAASNVVMFAAAIVMTGFAFAFVGMLALFGLLAVGVAMIAAPFVMNAPAASDNATS